MYLIASHLEQISSSARSIADLDFPPPQIFTNALLGSHEITTLIRDTEPHERALFSLDPDASRISRRSDASQNSGLDVERSVHSRKSIYATRPAVQQRSAVARVLGPAMLNEIRQSSGTAAREKGSVNVEVLLRGAEKLCEVYHVEGALEKIGSIRQRHEALSLSIAENQELVLQQQSKLNRFNTGSGFGLPEDSEDKDLESGSAQRAIWAEVNIEAEEAEIKELEVRKKALEERVAGMGKDLEGLLR